MFNYFFFFIMESYLYPIREINKFLRRIITLTIDIPVCSYGLMLVTYKYLFFFFPSFVTIGIHQS